jgi:hypothetical protein
MSTCCFLEEFSAIRVFTCHCLGEVNFCNFYVINVLLRTYLFISKIICLDKTLREEHKFFLLSQG